MLVGEVGRPDDNSIWNGNAHVLTHRLHLLELGVVEGDVGGFLGNGVVVFACGQVVEDRPVWLADVERQRGVLLHAVVVHLSDADDPLIAHVLLNQIGGTPCNHVPGLAQVIQHNRQLLLLCVLQRLQGNPRHVAAVDLHPVRVNARHDI